MKYTKAKLESLNTFIRGLNFAKIGDKNVRNTFLRLVPAVARLVKENEEDQKVLFEQVIGTFPADRRMAYDTANAARLDAMKKYQESNSEEDLKAFKDLNDAFLSEYKDILDAVVSYDKGIKEIMNDEVELNVEPISAEAFLDAMGDTVDVTAELLDMLSPIVDFE